MSVGFMPPSQEAIQNFVMPEVKQGMPVRWYPHGEIDGRTPEIGFVVKVGGRSIVLRTASGMQRDTVRHIDDPKLKLSVQQRENGAWDYTEDYLSQQEYKESVQQQLDNIKKSLAQLTIAVGKSAAK